MCVPWTAYQAMACPAMNEKGPAGFPASPCFLSQAVWPRSLLLALTFGTVDHRDIVGGEVLALHLAQRIVADRRFRALRQFGGMLCGGGRRCDQVYLIRGAHRGAQRGILRRGRHADAVHGSTGTRRGEAADVEIFLEPDRRVD